MHDVPRVKIYVTRDMAFNLKQMNQITANVLKKLGCEGCHSGRFLDFQMVEDFVVDPKTFDVHEAAGGVRF